MKLAKALGEETCKKSNVYILDEPSSGLSDSDILMVSRVIQRLADSGNTVVIIDHNIKFIADNADYIIDFGENGGKKGGKIVDSGYVYDTYLRKKASIWI